jgi:hypothetical protein
MQPAKCNTIPKHENAERCRFSGPAPLFPAQRLERVVPPASPRTIQQGHANELFLVYGRALLKLPNGKMKSNEFA